MCAKEVCCHWDVILSAWEPWWPAGQMSLIQIACFWGKVSFTDGEDCIHWGRSSDRSSGRLQHLIVNLSKSRCAQLFSTLKGSFKIISCENAVCMTQESNHNEFPNWNRLERESVWESLSKLNLSWISQSLELAKVDYHLGVWGSEILNAEVVQLSSQRNKTLITPKRASTVELEVSQWLESWGKQQTSVPKL